MRHKIAGRKLGRSSSHRRALYRNLVTDLLDYEKITTTEAKAKEARSLMRRWLTRCLMTWPQDLPNAWVAIPG